MLAAGDSLYDLLRRLHFSTLAASIAELALAVLFIVLGSLVVSRLGSRAARRSVESLVARSTLPGAAVRSIGRARTLAGVAASVVRIVVWSVAALLVLDQLGINLGPLLAGASIVGVALGFGAQSLVRDFLSGFFILAEDQYGVGDVITISDTTGTVEEVNLRRELDDLGADAEWSASVLEPPEVLGVEAMGPDGTTVRVAAKTDPGARARVARELRARILSRLRTEGVVPVQERT
ncbi:MAG: mechanosensitive ion channel family protein [Acidimicrobiales bacterium]